MKINYFTYGECFSKFIASYSKIPFISDETNLLYLLSLLINEDASEDDFYKSWKFISEEDNVKHVNEHVLALFNEVAKRYWKHYFALVKEDEDELEEIKLSFYPLFNLINYTFDKYTTILDFYASNKAKLMDKLKGNSKTYSRFNDTPQNGGAYDDDKHTTTYTEGGSESETDNDTIIARLNEIEAKYSNVLFNWVNELEGLFIEEENIL